MEFLATALLQHAQLRASGADGSILRASALEVRDALIGLDPVGQQVEIGEHLTGYLLNYAIKNFSRHDVAIEGDTAVLTSEDHDLQVKLANFADAVFILDGAYGIDSGEILSVVTRYLEEIKKTPPEKPQ
jgi:hypothetical protein